MQRIVHVLRDCPLESSKWRIVLPPYRLLNNTRRRSRRPTMSMQRILSHQCPSHLNLNSSLISALWTRTNPLRLKQRHIRTTQPSKSLPTTQLSNMLTPPPKSTMQRTKTALTTVIAEVLLTLQTLTFWDTIEVLLAPVFLHTHKMTIAFRPCRKLTMLQRKNIRLRLGKRRRRIGMRNPSSEASVNVAYAG